MTEKEQLQAEVKELKQKLEPLEARLREIYRKESDDIEAKVKRCNQMQDKFELDELRFSAEARCACGAGLAYPKNIGMHGSWDCSDILLGRAIPSGQDGAKKHDEPFPFVFYSIRSEDENPNDTRTTRPER